MGIVKLFRNAAESGEEVSSPNNIMTANTAGNHLAGKCHSWLLKLDAEMPKDEESRDIALGLYDDFDLLKSQVHEHYKSIEALFDTSDFHANWMPKMSKENIKIAETKLAEYAAFEMRFYHLELQAKKILNEE